MLCWGQLVGGTVFTNVGELNFHSASCGVQVMLPIRQKRKLRHMEIMGETEASWVPHSPHSLPSRSICSGGKQSMLCGAASPGDTGASSPP